MVNIISYGVYVPLWRLDLGILGSGGWGEKAIANFDEDSLTMGVAAGINCLRGIDPATIDGLFFATTTSPYREKQISVTAATALNLRTDIMTADFANSLRAGTTALMAAVNAVKAGSAKRIMVIASDMRVPMPGSDFERFFGDGAAAFIVGDENVGVAIKDSYNINDEILDIWRVEDDKFVRSWEARFTIDEGYFRVLPAAVSGLIKKNELTPKDFSKAAFCGPDPRRHRDMARILGFDAAQVQDPIFGSVGDTGAAFSLMILATLLEEVKPGNRLLLASYGSGAEAFLLEVVKEFDNKQDIKSHISTKRVLKDYKVYLLWRGLVEMAMGGRRRPGNPAPSASALWREVDKNIRLRGVKCNHCGSIQYPPQTICFNCGSHGQFESYLFSDKSGSLFTYSVDNMTPTPDPPLVLAIVDFEGGGRIWLSMTDKNVNELEAGMPVELTFRKLFDEGGIHNYYWKCMPVRA